MMNYLNVTMAQYSEKEIIIFAKDFSPEPFGVVFNTEKQQFRGVDINPKRRSRPPQMNQGNVQGNAQGNVQGLAGLA